MRRQSSTWRLGLGLGCTKDHKRVSTIYHHWQLDLAPDWEDLPELRLLGLKTDLIKFRFNFVSRVYQSFVPGLLVDPPW